MIPDVEPVYTYSGNNSNTIFEYDCLINSENELLVQLTDMNEVQVTLVQNIDYSVSGIGNENGGHIIFPLETSSYTKLKSNEKITLSLILPISQEAPYSFSSKLNFKSLENSFDYITRICQILRRQVKRCIKVKEGSEANPDELLASIDNSVTLASVSANLASDFANNALSSANAASSAETNALNSANAAASSAASVNMPTPVALSYIRQKSDLTGYENMDVSQVREDLDPDVVDFGNMTATPTFEGDKAHKGYVKNSMTLALPTVVANKLKNILFDFNIEPGRSITWPANIKWDYGTAPSLAVYPAIALTTITLSNMVLTCPATNGQYADLTSVNFHSLGSQSWERIWKVNPTQVGVVQQIVGSNVANLHLPVVNISATNKYNWYLSSNGSTTDIANGVAGTYTVANGVTHYIKEQFTGTQYILSVSTNGVDWTPDITIASSTPVYSASTTSRIRLGNHIGAMTGATFKGTIDLAEASVKIAGGRNLLTPEDGVYLNRVIFDAMDGGAHYRGHHLQGAL